MIQLYCHGHHGTRGDELCSSCRQLFEYASARTKACKFGEDKPVCVKCPIHCYKPGMRKSIREVMRWSGPRMLWSHPYLALRHLVDSKKPYPSSNFQ
ncbi:MAG TPA: nitrous oxide-stimulated promoter family protein [Spirochaetales bacterium]|nr:nitrous oxide-stimulated promoter family protein [Spirochaetales bacterium]HPS14458.1 nitrous oxide-stimulated promoter family protein [Spirochaetales bacterium]